MVLKEDFPSEMNDCNETAFGTKKHIREFRGGMIGG
jgi:hypothetical protein